MASNTGRSEALPPGTAAAVRRSLQIYRRDRDREPRLDAWYGQFVKPGALVFDIGAHAGDRTACFARLGARVVADQGRLEREPGVVDQHVDVVGAGPERHPGLVLAGAQVGDHRGHLDAELARLSERSRIREVR